LQIKAETHILADVQANLDAISKSITAGDVGSKLKAKQDLLSILIANEQSRLLVWLFPLDHTKKNHFALNHSRAGLPDVSICASSVVRKLTMLDCCNRTFEDCVG
jgi:phosphatidylinositol 4-kinase